MDGCMNTMQNVNKNQDPHNGKEKKNLVFCLELFFNTFLFFLSPRIHLDFDTNFALRFKQSSTSKCIFYKKDCNNLHYFLKWVSLRDWYQWICTRKSK